MEGKEQEFARLKERYGRGAALSGGSFSPLSDADLRDLVEGRVVEATRRVWVSGHLRHKVTRKDTVYLRYDEASGNLVDFNTRAAAERMNANGRSYEKNKSDIMAQENYVPHPVDTSGVDVSSTQHAALIEQVARQAHEDWMLSREAEGILQGLTFEQIREKYPMMKPWEDLAPQERASSIDSATEAVKLLEKTWGIDRVMSSDGGVTREMVVDAIAENAHEVWARQRMESGWTYGEVRDNDLKKHPMLKPYSEIPDSEKEYDRKYGELVWSGVAEMAKTVREQERIAARRPIDEFLGGDPEKGAVYGLAFDKAAEYLRDVLRKMSDYVGWKDQSRPYDFDGFSGYYPEIHDDHADICEGDYIVASFFAKPDGTLGFKSYGGEFSQYPEGVNPWYPLADIMDGRLCLEPGNLEKARQETHQGQEVIYAVRFGEDAAVGCRPEDVRLKAAFAEREPSLRFVSPETLVSAMERWMEADARPGFEAETRPEVVRYAWDGDRLRSEKEVNIDQPRQLKESWGNDWVLIDAMRSEGEEIRSELERAAGIPEGEGRHFKFEHALYPCLGIRDDALFLASGCGRTMGDFITVANGNVSLYREYDPDNALSEPLRRFDSAKHAMGIVRKHILGEKNVSLAAADYQSYLKSQAETKVQKKDNEPSKGVKMR